MARSRANQLPPQPPDSVLLSNTRSTDYIILNLRLGVLRLAVCTLRSVQYSSAVARHSSLFRFSEPHWPGRRRRPIVNRQQTCIVPFRFSSASVVRASWTWTLRRNVVTSRSRSHFCFFHPARHRSASIRKLKFKKKTVVMCSARSQCMYALYASLAYVFAWYIFADYCLNVFLDKYVEDEPVENRHFDHIVGKYLIVHIRRIYSRHCTCYRGGDGRRVSLPDVGFISSR